MKWIKTFEELKPETYRNAGNKLNTMIGKRGRADKLIDYGNEIEYGFYNMSYGVTDDSLSKRKFTKPNVKFDIIMDSVTGNDADIDIEDAVDYWSYGNRKLAFYLTFSFVAEQDTYTISGKSVPLFSFEVEIAHETSEEDEDEDIYKLYQDNKTLNISIIQPVLDFKDDSAYGGARKYKYNGIFSDRKSALKFKKELPNLINDEIHGEIQKLFSLLGAETDDVVNCIEGILNPSINYLYNEDASRNSLYSSGNIIQNPSKYKPSDIPKAIEKPSTITTTGDYKPVYNLKREQ